MLYPSSSVEPSVWTTSEPWCSRDTSPRWKEPRLFYVHSTFKLYELVIVLWLSFGRLIENWAEYMVCFHVWERPLDGHGETYLRSDFCFFFFFWQSILIQNKGYRLLIKFIQLKKSLPLNILQWFSHPKSTLFHFCHGFYNVVRAILLDEDVCGNHHFHKRQIKPPEKDVGGCVGLLYRFSCATNLILHGLIFSVAHQRFTVTQAREPEKESKITLWPWVAPARHRPKPSYPWQR